MSYIAYVISDINNASSANRILYAYRRIYDIAQRDRVRGWGRGKSREMPSRISSFIFIRIYRREADTPDKNDSSFFHTQCAPCNFRTCLEIGFYTYMYGDCKSAT